MEKQRPTELNKKIKQLRSSRDKLKDLGRQKTVCNKKLRDRNVEITTNRDFWKKRCKEHLTVQEELEKKLNTSLAEIERERARADMERERAEKLEIEIAKIGEKK